MAMEASAKLDCARGRGAGLQVLPTADMLHPRPDIVCARGACKTVRLRVMIMLQKSMMACKQQCRGAFRSIDTWPISSGGGLGDNRRCCLLLLNDLRGEGCRRHRIDKRNVSRGSEGMVVPTTTLPGSLGSRSPSCTDSMSLLRVAAASLCSAGSACGTQVIWVV